MDPIGASIIFGIVAILWLTTRWRMDNAATKRAAVGKAGKKTKSPRKPPLKNSIASGSSGKPKRHAAPDPRSSVWKATLTWFIGLFRRGRSEDQHKGLYIPQPLLNKEERVLFVELEKQIRSIFGSGYSLMCQVSLGEILKSKDHGAFWKINNKRADFVLMGPTYMPVATIEYQGSGHWGFTEEHAEKARKSDELKRKALRSAGISMIEVFQNWTPRSLRKQIVSLKKRKL